VLAKHRVADGQIIAAGVIDEPDQISSKAIPEVVADRLEAVAQWRWRSRRFWRATDCGFDTSARQWDGVPAAHMQTHPVAGTLTMLC